MAFSKRTSDVYLVMDSVSGNINCDIAGPLRHLYLLELKKATLYVSSNGQQTYSKIEVFFQTRLEINVVEYCCCVQLLSPFFSKII